MNKNFQKEKKLVLDYYKALDKAEGDEISKVLSNYIGKDYIWRGFHPFNCLLYTSPSPRDRTRSRMPSSA